MAAPTSLGSHTVLLLFIAVALLCVFGPVHSSSRSTSSESSRSLHELFPSHRVNVSAIPGLRFTRRQLVHERHYSGYLPTQSTSDLRHDDSSDPSSIPRLFYYLVKQRSPAADATRTTPTPLVVWFNGGPGCASTVALLQEHGPFTLQHSPFLTSAAASESSSLFHSQRSAAEPLEFELVFNEYSWSVNAHVLYLDQPVGVGFSTLADLSKDDIPNSQGAIARELHFALTHFLTVHHPELADSPLSLAGESYAAKYIPSFAAYTLGRNQCKERHGKDTSIVEKKEDKESDSGKREREDRHVHRYAATFRSLNISLDCHDGGADLRDPPLPLKSLLIGNGVFSPLLQRFAFRPLALALGLMDVKQANQYAALESHCLGLLRRAVITETSEELLIKAEHACGRMHTLILAMSGHVETSDLRRYTAVFNRTLFTDFLNHPQLRSAWHIPSSYPLLKSDCNSVVHERLRADTMRGVRGLLAFLLYSMPVTVYTGSFDLKDGTWANEVLFDSLWDWDDRAAWFLSRRYIWRPLRELPANSAYVNATRAFLVNHTDNVFLSSGAEDVYGYSKSYGNLSFVTVSQAGHMVASSQPQKAADLFYRFTHTRPFYNDESDADRQLNAKDVGEVCELLHCDADKHGYCDERTALCVCDDNWTGATCTIPVHHITSEVVPVPASQRRESASERHEPASGLYTHYSIVSPQHTDLYYLHLTPDDVKAVFDREVKRHSSYTSHQTVDNVMASCTFKPPLLLRVHLVESAAPHLTDEHGRPLSKRERNLGLPSDGHLTLSALWTSRFHNRSPRNATLFLGSFDASNTFFSSGGATDAQSIAPKLLGYLSSPSKHHTLHVWVERCDHYAIKISNMQGALHDIAYNVSVELGRPSADEVGHSAGAHAVAHGDGEGRTRTQSTGVESLGHHERSAGKGAMAWLPWALCAVLGLLVVGLLWREEKARGHASVEERRPLL